jgi:hypothetical protein
MSLSEKINLSKIYCCITHAAAFLTLSPAREPSRIRALIASSFLPIQPTFSTYLGLRLVDLMFQIGQNSEDIIEANRLNKIHIAH